MTPFAVLFPERSDHDYSRCSWTELSRRLIEVQLDGSWINDSLSTSFTSFVKNLSNETKINETLLWRYRLAGIFYNSIRDRFKWPKIELLSDKVSPDSLEILGKLKRVLPDDMFVKFAKGVYDQTIKRDGLREAWILFKPALLGKTSRGSNTVTPKIVANANDPEQTYLLNRAHFMNSLKSDDMEWCKYDEANHYRVFGETVLPSEENSYFPLDVDAVVIVKGLTDLEIETHGIQYVTTFSKNLLANLEVQEKYFDKMWVASTQSFDKPWINTRNPKDDGAVSSLPETSLANILPAHIGMISVGKSKNILKRHAGSGGCVPVLSNIILKKLLLE